MLSTAFGHLSVGGSGALLGMIGVLLAMTVGRKTAGMMMMRSQLIRWLIYIGVMGIMMSGTPISRTSVDLFADSQLEK